MRWSKKVSQSAFAELSVLRLTDLPAEKSNWLDCGGCERTKEEMEEGLYELTDHTKRERDEIVPKVR